MQQKELNKRLKQKVFQLLIDKIDKDNFEKRFISTCRML